MLYFKEELFDLFSLCAINHINFNKIFRYGSLAKFNLKMKILKWNF